MRVFLGGAYKAEINPDNPLGRGGELAEAFGALMQKLWKVRREWMRSTARLPSLRPLYEARNAAERKYGMYTLSEHMCLMAWKQWFLSAVPGNYVSRATVPC
jgi:hypothetical protein